MNKILLVIKVGVLLFSAGIVTKALLDPTQDRRVALLALSCLLVIAICHELMDYLEGKDV